jgi:hypothetical protein
MRETQAIIERVSRLSDSVQRLHLAVEDSLLQIKPGQSLLARMLPERWDPYLREQWWPVGILEGQLVVERPGNLGYEPGQAVSLLGPVGQPFRYKRNLRNVLLIADHALPIPLLMAVPALISNRVSVTLVLAGMEARRYPTQVLPPEVEVIHADDDLGWPKQVMTFGWADQIFATVNADDEMGRMQRIWTRIRALRAEIPQYYLFAVAQPILPCGAGACGACLVTLREGAICTVCLDGPAIDMTKLPFE